MASRFLFRLGHVLLLLLELVDLVLEGNIVSCEVELVCVLGHDYKVIRLRRESNRGKTLVRIGAHLSACRTVAPWLAVSVCCQGCSRLREMMRRYGLSKLRDVLVAVDLLQGPGYLGDMLLLVIFKQLKLGVHTVHHLFLLAQQGIEGLLSMLILLGACVVVLSVHLDVFEGLAPLDLQARYVSLKIADIPQSFLLVEIGFVGSLYLLE